MIPFPWPQENKVHIHRAVLGSEAERYVSLNERVRAERLLDPYKKKRFLAGRGLLREILGGYLGIQPDEVHFTMGEHGKPCLSTTAGNKEQLHFNLSHSGTMFLLAITATREVGVDIEQLNNDIPFSDMARIAFSPREQKELFDLPHHLQLAAFYRCWTRKEAYLKASGMGFALKSNRFDVSLLPETPVAVAAPDNQFPWLLWDIDVPLNHCAALAVKGPCTVIHYID